MRNDGIRVTAVLLALVLATALPCTFGPVTRTLASDVRSADVIVRATPRASAQDGSGERLIVFDVHESYKGTERRTVEVLSDCTPSMCEFACFSAGEPLLLFLSVHEEDRWSSAPRYRHASPWGVNRIIEGSCVRDGLQRWSDVRNRLALRDGVLVPADVEGVRHVIPFPDFERVVRREVTAERELPLTYRFTY